MDITIKEQIKLYIEFLSGIPTNYESKEWIPTCIECLQFALDNEQLLNEKPELYQDTLSTLRLLYAWLKDNKEWAYIELREKFIKRYSPKEVGKALKEFSLRLSKQKEELYKNDEKITAFAELGIQVKNPDGTFKCWYDILEEMSKIWERSSLNMNSRWHMYISFVKSIVRIAGCVFSLIFNNWLILAIGLGVAEILGVLEEFGDKR